MINYISQLVSVYLEHGSFIAYFFIFFAGFLTSLTPCLYPVIPLTVGYFSAQAKHSKLMTFLLAIVYVLGISLVYTSFGIFAALTGTLFGRITNHPYMYFVIANICIFLALVLLDVFDLPLPGFLRNRGANTSKKGFIGAFIVGCSAGLVMGACATPVLAIILTYVATKQNIAFGAVSLFMFSLGNSLILIGIATFSGLLYLIPKSGAWMNVVKKILAFVLIGMGEYYLMKIIN